ncbi:MAG: NUDIX domain-containing protein [bacterium]
MKYKHAVIAIDAAMLKIKDGVLQILLMKMKKNPFQGYWAIPGRLVEADENLKEAAENKFYETTKVSDGYMEQLCTFGDVKRDPAGRVVSTAYIALISPNKKIAERAGELEWYNVKKLPRLAYDHKSIVEYAVKRLQSKITYTNIIYSLLPEEFTLSDLQKAYEIILNKELDKRNFRKKIFSLNLIRETGKKEYGLPKRPAQLYEFIDKKYKVMEIL